MANKLVMASSIAMMLSLIIGSVSAQAMCVPTSNGLEQCTFTSLASSGGYGSLLSASQQTSGALINGAGNLALFSLPALYIILGIIVLLFALRIFTPLLDRIGR